MVAEEKHRATCLNTCRVALTKMSPTGSLNSTDLETLWCDESFAKAIFELFKGQEDTLTPETWLATLQSNLQ